MMTSSEDPKKTAEQHRAVGPRKPTDGRELDAEIVRDLEVDERTVEVRGGCVGSLPGGCQHSAGL